MFSPLKQLTHEPSSLRECVLLWCLMLKGLFNEKKMLRLPRALIVWVNYDDFAEFLLMKCVIE